MSRTMYYPHPGSATPPFEDSTWPWFIPEATNPANPWEDGQRQAEERPSHIQAYPTSDTRTDLHVTDSWPSGSLLRTRRGVAAPPLVSLPHCKADGIHPPGTLKEGGHNRQLRFTRNPELRECSATKSASPPRSDKGHGSRHLRRPLTPCIRPQPEQEDEAFLDSPQDTAFHEGGDVVQQHQQHRDGALWRPLTHDGHPNRYAPSSSSGTSEGLMLTYQAGRVPC
jgi:hypothetical protein